MAWIGNFIKRNILSTESAPSKVLEVRTDKFNERQIITREESIVLYAGNANEKHEIILQKPLAESLSTGFSLYRSDDKESASRKFQNLKDKLPLLYEKTNANIQAIQKFCDIIEKNPTWNVCHLAVYFSMFELLNIPKVSSQIDTPEPGTGMSPIQLAIRESNLAMVNQLIKLGASLGHLDHEGNSVYHYAASTGKDIILALATHDETMKGLNLRNVIGYTPLHMACVSDKPDCVTTLISKGADVNLPASPVTSSTNPTYTAGYMGDFIATYPNKLLTEEMKFGGTPLHWASSKEVVVALLNRNCDINALNFKSRTALHVMVMRARLECVVTLLSREANPDIVDEDGNSALHLAVKQKNIPIIQALVSFNCDFNLLNNDGETARHLAALEDSEMGRKMVYTLHAVGAPRCSSIIPKCNSLCSSGGTDDGIPPPTASGPTPRPIADLLQAETLDYQPEEEERGGRLLCLDGGGIRGLVLILLLRHLEEAIGKPITHCFDWLAATSTGGILALALAAGKNLKEAFCLYFRMKDEIFSGFRPYNSEPLEAMLKEVLGSDTTMADISHPKLMITGCLADRKPVDLHFFRNYESASEILADWPTSPSTGPAFKPLVPYKEQLLWEAARASGAAPSYFRAYDRFIDGGLIANNPTLDAITEIHEFNTALKIAKRFDETVNLSLVVSLGTGSIPLVEVESMDIFWPSGIWDTAKFVTGVKSMQAILVDQATLSDGRVIDRTRAMCSMLHIPYFRFSPQLSEEIGMDEKSDEKLVNMLWESKAYIIANSHLVNKLATLLNC